MKNKYGEVTPCSTIEKSKATTLTMLPLPMQCKLQEQFPSVKTSLERSGKSEVQLG